MIHKTCPWCGAAFKHNPFGRETRVFTCASFENPTTDFKEQSGTCKSICKDQLIEKQKEEIRNLKGGIGNQKFVIRDLWKRIEELKLAAAKRVICNGCKNKVLETLDGFCIDCISEQIM